MTLRFAQIRNALALQNISISEALGELSVHVFFSFLFFNERNENMQSKE